MPDNTYYKLGNSPLAQSIGKALENIDKKDHTVKLNLTYEDGKKGAEIVYAWKMEENWYLGTIVGYDEKKKAHVGVEIVGSW